MAPNYEGEYQVRLMSRLIVKLRGDLFPLCVKFQTLFILITDQLA